MLKENLYSSIARRRGKRETTITIHEQNCRLYKSSLNNAPRSLDLDLT